MAFDHLSTGVEPPSQRLKHLVTAGERVIVTGGSGFIGSNLVAFYRDCGADVINIDKLPPRDEAQRPLWREADIVDEQSRLTYRIRSQDDGSGGSLVRVDVDPSAGKGYAALTGTAMGGISLTMFALGLLFSATTLAGAGVAMAAVGGFILFRTLAKLGSATKSAKAIASHALMEADDAAARQPKALRSGG